MNVLFLCTGNSCRSQMAEGWARHFHADLMNVYSAGTKIHGLNRIAVRVMAEAGIDISEQRSKRIENLKGIDFDVVITVCDSAHEACPILPGVEKTLHFPFDDPPRLAERTFDEDEALGHYRRVRDEIRVFVETLPDRLEL